MPNQTENEQPLPEAMTPEERRQFLQAKFEADKQAIEELSNEQVEEVVGGASGMNMDELERLMRGGPPTQPKRPTRDEYNPLKRTAAQTHLDNYQSGPNKLLKVSANIIR